MQKILNDHGLSSRHDGWLVFEPRNVEHDIEIWDEQAAFLEKLNPRFRARQDESAAPANSLCANTFFVGRAAKGRHALQADLDAPLVCYNTDRLHLGDRN